jgi:hypothetical protein
MHNYMDALPNLSQMDNSEPVVLIGKHSHICCEHSEESDLQ